MYALCEDSHGALWFGTNGGGASRYDGRSWQSFNLDNGLAGQVVLVILRDRANTLWFGTNNGLSRYEGVTWTSYDRHDGLASNDVYTLAFSGNTLWTGALGGGISWYDNDGWHSFVDASANPAQVGYPIHMDRSGILWVGNFRKALWQYDGVAWRPFEPAARFAGRRINTILMDRRDRLWIGIKGEGLHQYETGIWTVFDTSDGLAGVDLSCLFEDRDGVLWAGTMDSGVSRYDGKTWTSFTTRDGLAGQVVRSIYQDRTGHVWVGFNDGGASVYDGQRWRTFTTADGLAGNSVEAILQDRSGTFWFGTEGGASRYDGRVFQTINREDGLAGNSVKSICEDVTGALWFATSGGITRYVPPPAAKPSVRITGIVADERYTALSHLSVASTEKLIRIEFGGASLKTRPDGLIYRYRLQGHDPDWKTTRATSVEYPGLPRGDYRFEAQAVDRDLGYSARPATLDLSVHLPYGTISLVAALTLALIGIVWQTRRVILRDRRLQASNKALFEAKERTEEQARKIVELDEVKTRFFANVSHELRTPLTLTLGPLEDAVEGRFGPIGPALHPQLNLMLRNGRRLLRLINQLLDIARLDAGQMTLRLRRHDIVDFIRRITAQFTSLAERKQIAFQFHPNKEVIPLSFDEDKLEKVAFNLLANAFKFTPDHGKILVTLEDKNDLREYPGQTVVCLSVKDTGCGISKEDLPPIFDRFRQARATSSQRQMGTGIGLSLSKELVALHGGTVQAISELGFGSEFTVVLPAWEDDVNDPYLSDETAVSATGELTLTVLEDSAPLDVGTEIAFNQTSQAEDKTSVVLVVDDNVDVRRYIEAILVQQYQIRKAADGVEGLQIARSARPDLIISDVMMPNMDGFAFCRAVKTDPLLERTPFILLTAKASDDTRVEGLELGADDYLSKPFNSRELLARVHNLITLKRQERELKAFKETLETQVRNQLDTILRNARLTRYVPSKLVDRILSAEEPVSLSSERKQITIFFSDLVGFTELCDRLEPERVTDILNTYLTAMVHEIETHDGTLARFMGDGIMAFFGAHDDADARTQAERAVAMGVAMQHRVNALNGNWPDMVQRLTVRMGIAQDYVTVGNFGSPALMEYTAVGRGVNLASRLEATCSPGRIRVSHPVYAFTQNHYRYDELPEQEMKGFPYPVRVYELDPSGDPE